MTRPVGVTRGVSIAFRIGVFFQLALGLAQLVSGLVLSLSPSGSILRVVEWLTRNEIVEDPESQGVALLTQWASHLPNGSEGFYTLYLIGHGLLNLFAATAILRHWPGAYPLSMVVLTVFTVFQVWEYFHSFDPMLLILTAIDVAVIVVISIEERQRRRGLRASARPVRP
jgi:uncharacterized membrane protein